MTETKYLGLIISINGIKIDFAKIKTICTWNTSTSVKKRCSFIEFCNFYHQFIQGFSKIACTLNIFIKKKNANKLFKLM